MQALRWLVVDADEPSAWVGVFGMPDTADSKEEAVFWAERWAGKNGAHFVRPSSFVGIEGRLPE